MSYGKLHLVFKEDIYNYFCMGNQSEVLFLVTIPLALNLCPSKLFSDVTKWIQTRQEKRMHENIYLQNEMLSA